MKSHPQFSRRYPVTILAGFLGSGKTTLLNRILREDHGIRFAALVNDFGAVNIDARLVDSLERDAVNLSNGCVCCSMRGGLVAGVERLLSRRTPPDHILVEASGVADPAGVAGAFFTTQLRGATRLDSIITLVDAAHVRDRRVDAQLVETQLRVADFVVLNKIDLVSEATRTDLIAWIHGLEPAVRIVPAVGADIPLRMLIGNAREQTNSEKTVRSQSAETFDHVGTFETWHGSVAYPLAYRRVRSMLERLPLSVFRSKGILWLADAPNLRFSMHVVGSRVDIEVLSPWEKHEVRGTEIVCIGTRGAMSSSWLHDHLQGCFTDSIPLMSREGLLASRRCFREQPQGRGHSIEDERVPVTQRLSPQSQAHVDPVPDAR